MNDKNVKIAEWAGISPIKMCDNDSDLDQECLESCYDPSECSFLRFGGKWESCAAKKAGYPDYEHSNAAAVELLPMLVEKGYWWEMHMVDKCKQVQVSLHQYGIYETHGVGQSMGIAMAPTISEAITAAVLQLIKREKL